MKTYTVKTATGLILIEGVSQTKAMQIASHAHCDTVVSCQKK